MQGMVDEALAFFRDDAVSEETTSFDLPHVLLTMANDYADQAIDIRYRGHAHAVYRGRPFALKRAFTNLIDNAAKYAKTPEIELSREETALVVAIRDRGPGIPADALDNVFRPYYRIDKSRNRPTGGVGFGAAVARTHLPGPLGVDTHPQLPAGGPPARVLFLVAPLAP